jgi:NIMA (never in mitosis gene a)-related kinase 1/4/5
MEYADGGDIFQMIKDHQKQNKLIDEDDIWKIFIQATRGLKTLHDIKIIHRDLKCANIFLMKNKTAKLGDLNVSKVMKQDMYKTQTGTPYYASPEVWKDQPYDWRSDIWSLGCVLYEMITLKPPFRAQNMEGLYKKVVRGIYPKINMETYSEDIAAVVKSLLQVNPDLRPSCADILSNAEVKQYADLLCPEDNYSPVR